MKKLIADSSWRVQFNTFNPMESLCQIQFIEQTNIYSSEYYWQGSDRCSKAGTFFQYTLSGHGVFDDGKEEHLLIPGCGFIVRSCDPVYKYFYPEDATEPWKVLWGRFIGGNVENIIQEINKIYGYVFELPLNDGVIIKYLSYQSDKFSSEFNLSASECSAIGMELINRLISSKEQEIKNSSKEYLISKALNIIADNSNTLLNTSDIADILHVSREHFSRIFKKQLGISPYKYIISRKVDQAKTKLSHSTDSIKEIAFQLGFANAPHFTLIFKKSTGVNPKNYRYIHGSR